MVFSSQLFLYWFLPGVLLLYFATPRRARNLLLTLVSFLFYGWGNPLLGLLLLLSILIDYVAGLRLVSELPQAAGEPLPLLEQDGPRTPRQKRALALSLTANLFSLGVFKYFGFAIDSWNATVSALGLAGFGLEHSLRVALPVGIGFRTLQSMSYAIDVYRGQARATRSLIDLCCFQSMFPLLVAGPIVRYAELADQLRSRRTTFERFARGIALFACGLAKKVLLANTCAVAADAAFGAASLLPMDAWFGAVAFAFQIYFHLSGYADMAVGLGLMLGFELTRNFDSPYRSQSVTEFWRRWHISFTSWLRDNLYRSLGGEGGGPWRTWLSLAAVVLLGGLWHGAAWNFVIWGALHGLLLASEHVAGRIGRWRRPPRPLAVGLTFTVVLISWVVFRAPTLSGALHYLGAMFALGEPTASARLVSGILYSPAVVIATLGAAVVTWSFPQAWVWTRRIGLARALASLALLASSLALLATQGHNPLHDLRF